MAYTNLAINKKGRSTIEIAFEIPEEETSVYYKRALEKLGKDVSLPGFRKGHVPERVLVERLGEQTILEEAAKIALKREYPNLVEREKLSVIGSPKAEITKLARGNAFGFKIESAVVPEITLPTYKTIAKEITSKPIEVEVTEGEIENLITEIRRNKWRIEHKEKAEKGVSPNEDELPPLSDEMVHQLGDFSDVADFKQKAREGLRHEKQQRVKDQRRAELGEKLVAESSIELPDILIKGELDNMTAQFKHNLSHANTSFEDYLKRINKTEADLRDEWREQAIKRGKLQLILSEIAKKESIRPDPASVEREVEHALKHVKNADPTRVRASIEHMLRNEETFKTLESL